MQNENEQWKHKAELFCKERDEAIRARQEYEAYTIEEMRKERDEALARITEVLAANKIQADALWDLGGKIEALNRRYDELQKELHEQCRINGIGAQRELALQTKVKELEAKVQGINADKIEGG